MSMVMWLLLWACSNEGTPADPGAASGEAQHDPGKHKAGSKGPPHGQPGAGVGGFDGGPMGGQGGGSGAALQDPCGFPAFHDQQAPQGPAITQAGDWSAPVSLSPTQGGGYRPQITVGADDRLHAVYYERLDAGDLIRHRVSDGSGWGEPAHVGFRKNRNWGPDIVARDDGSLVMVFDYALEDFSSQGYLTEWTDDGGWSEPEALTQGNSGATKVEVGSGHVANANGGDLAYVWIGKTMSETSKFKASWRWRVDGDWSDPVAFSDGSSDAWHTNVERRPDGSVLVGFDIGTGGGETQLHIAEGRDGSFSALENLSDDAGDKPGERPHFAFGADGVDHITWFHKVEKLPQHIYVRSGIPGDWGAIEEPSAGYGGFHFDPEIAINEAGTRVLIWGWDAGPNQEAEMVYSVSHPDQPWTAPMRIASINWGKPGLSSIDVDSEGNFHVAWNQGVRCDNRVYYAKLVVDK